MLYYDIIKQLYKITVLTAPTLPMFKMPHIGVKILDTDEVSSNNNSYIYGFYTPCYHGVVISKPE